MNGRVSRIPKMQTHLPFTKSMVDSNICAPKSVYSHKRCGVETVISAHCFKLNCVVWQALFIFTSLSNSMDQRDINQVQSKIVGDCLLQDALVKIFDAQWLVWICLRLISPTVVCSQMQRQCTSISFVWAWNIGFHNNWMSRFLQCIFTGLFMWMLKFFNIHLRHTASQTATSVPLYSYLCLIKPQ